MIALLLLACSADLHPSLGAQGRAVPPAPLATDGDGPVLNELMARNDSTLTDGAGGYGDWAEVYNPTDAVLDLSGYRLISDGETYTFPDGTGLAAQGRALVWLDGEPEEGEDHAPFALDSDEGELSLTDPDGVTQDTLDWEDLGGDQVLGRFPDGDAYVTTSIKATPYNQNPWDPGLSEDPSEVLFPEGRILRMDLYLSDDAIDSLNADPYTDVEGGLAFEGAYFPAVGVRRKGVYGSLRNLNQKAAFRINLDLYADQRLRGLEHVTLNNMVQDPSCVHELLAYHLFREVGVPAPRVAYAELYLNNTYRGLYLHVETIDDVFLERWYDNPNGNLYEGAYGTDVNLSYYTSLEHDEQGSEDPSDYSDLRAVAELLAQTPSEDLADDYAALVDVDEVAAMFAVEALTAHWDGYLYYPNNYRIYHNPDTNQISLIPWGTDQTFGSAYSTFYAAGDLAAWMFAVPSLRERYMLKVWEVYDVMMALGLDEEALEAQALIASSLEADPYKEISVETSQAYVAYTLSFLESYPAARLAEVFPDGAPGLE